jgi:hypothetical protein
VADREREERENVWMPDLSALLASLAAAVIIAFLLMFALGSQRNVRRGEAFMQWMQEGLPLLGKKTTLRWFGTSAVELKITEPSPPFRSAETLVVLEARDIGWMWALGRVRGRRDFIILRARLERSPAFELEAGDDRGWTGSDRLKRLDSTAWSHESWNEVRVAHTAGADTALVRDIWTKFSTVTGGVWRMSVRREQPHIEVHVLPPDTGVVSARPLFEAFRELAHGVMKS